MAETSGRFKRVGEALVWEEVRTFELKDTGCIYVAYKEGDERHNLYKLQRHERGSSDKPDVFVWYGMWNTCCVAGHPPKTGRGPWVHRFPSMQAAIEAMLEHGWIVKRTYLSDIGQLLHRAV